jgi:hypothetical protein
LTKYAFPLGRIASAMERLQVPPLTAIVVKGITGLPSSGIDGFIIQYLELDREGAKAFQRDDGVRRKLVKKLWNKIFTYKNWREVMAQLGITGDPTYDK